MAKFESRREEIENDTEIIPITESNLKEFADELQFEILAHECIVEDLAKSYHISVEDVFVIIHELKRRGNNVVTLSTTANSELDPSMPEQNVQVTLVRNFGHQKLIDEMNYNIIDNDDQIKCLVISDLRFGSIYQQVTIVNDLVSRAKQLGCKYVILCGDNVEGIFTGAKSIYNATLHQYGAIDQAKYFAKMFPRVEGMKILFINGEHDLSFLRTKEKVDIGYSIANQREDMVYLGPKRRTITFSKDIRNSGTVSVYVHHAQGSVPYTISYKPQQKISSMRNEDKTNILLTSHYGACDSFERRGVRSYQIPTVVATTDEMRAARTPVYNTIGGWVLTINRDKKGNFLGTSQLWIPYFDTIKDDYRNARQLYLTDKKQTYIPVKRRKEPRDQLYYSIKNGEELSSVLDKLKINELQFGGLVEEFIAKGYHIQTIEKDGKIVISKKSKRLGTIKIKPDLEELTKISETWIADTHLCNEAQQLHMINEIYLETAKRGIKVVRHFGDISDGDYQNRKEHNYELFRSGLTRQLKYIIEKWPYIDGVKTYLIDGNHDLTHVINGGAVLGELIAQARPDIIWEGKEHAIVHPIDKDNNELAATIEMYHPGGGCASSLSYRLQKYIDKLEPGCKPNVIGEGHYHQSEFLSYRNVIGLLVPCLTSKSNFAIRQGLENTMGAYFINMYVNKKGEIEMFEFEEKRFTEKDVIRNDWEKTKQLIIE